MPSLDIRSCLDDSPSFRKRIQLCEESVHNFEQSLKTLIKLARLQVDISQEYGTQQQELAREFISFSSHQDDPIISQALEKFGRSFTEVEKNRNMFNSHVMDTFINPLESFLKNTIGPIKELRKKFEKSSDDVDSALSKYMSKKPKDPTLAEVAKELADARKQFLSAYMEYISKLNDIQAKKKVDYMENVLALMYTKSAFHHQSYELLKDLEPYMRDLTGLLHDTRVRYDEEGEEEQEYQQACEKMPAEHYNPLQMTPKSNGVAIDTHKSGYLFERKNGRVYQTWTRKYFRIYNGELISTTRHPKSSKDEDGTTTNNLRVCSVKLTDSYDRRFCFELISPNRVLVLQAETEQDMNEWVQSLRTAAQLALNSESTEYSQIPHNMRKTMGDSFIKSQSDLHEDGEAKNKLQLKKIRFMPGNDKCADCGVNDPEWACTNLGIVICIECCGIHRSLGVHVSKVRSIILDRWDTEAIEVMLKLGNQVCNGIYEELVNSAMEGFRTDASSNRGDRDLWITEKYVKKSFVRPTELDPLSLNQAFWDSIKAGDLPKSLKYLAQGADIDYRNPGDESRTALHKAVDNEDEVSVEFLLQRQIDIDQTDGKGWSALHYAASNNSVRLVLSLLKRHAKADIKDSLHMTPLDIAVDCQSVQAVTALRLFAFEKQHNSSPSNSLDFGFREAMSSFKNTNHDRPTSLLSSQSVVGLKTLRSINGDSETDSQSTK
ncbi:hypothetical protein BDB01DRAFT_802335 [Pilobolus umbonatus]|nr:hypothetical protein BDB01DRAFT_802335 [Pilobolus umbonatus]